MHAMSTCKSDHQGFTRSVETHTQAYLKMGELLVFIIRASRTKCVKKDVLIK